MSKGIARQTIEIEPRCLKALTRNRDSPLIEFGQRPHLGDVLEGLFGVRRGQRLIPLQGRQLAVQPGSGRHPDLDVQVRSLPLNKSAQR